MDMTPMYALMDAMILACGVYVVYLYLDMMKTGAIKSSMLLPQNLNIKKCKDVQGFIRFTGGKQLAFGVISIICGAAGLFQDFTQKLGTVPYVIAITAFFVVAIWYAMQIKKAIRLFW